MRRIKSFTRGEIAALTPEEVAEVNATRSPDDWIKPEALCASRLPTHRHDGTLIERPNSTCANMAGLGTPHPGWGKCAKHGGNTPAGKKYAARQAGRHFLDQQKVRWDMFGGDRTLVRISEEEALLEEVRRSVAMVRFLEERIAHFEIAALADISSFDSAQLGGLPSLIDETSKGAATITDVNAWLLLYREERSHAAKTAKMAIDAGLNARLVRIAEDQGRMLASAVKAVLAALDLSPTQAALVPQVVPGILRSVAEGTAEPLPATNRPPLLASPSSPTSLPPRAPSVAE